jgi:hypothetical protein
MRAQTMHLAAADLPRSRPTDSVRHADMPLVRPTSVGLRTARVLTVVIVALVTVSSAAGLWITGLYREPPATEALFRAYDLVALAVAAPALLLATLLARRGSARAQLAWAGMLAYAVYAYAFYVFGTAFNDLFLVHVAIFSLSIFALVFTLANLDVAGHAASFRQRTPVKTVSGLLLLLAIPIGAFWVFFSLRMALTDQLPADTLLVQPLPALHLSYVLDLAVLVPSYVLAAVLLWRRVAWGYVAASVLLVSGLVHQLSYMTALAFQAQANVPGATTFDPQEPFIVAAFLIAISLLLANLPRRARLPGSVNEPE